MDVVSRRGHHTKNHESRRIPMNDALIEALRRHPRHINSPYIFCNAKGEPLKNVRTALRYAAKRAGIEDTVKMHQLRHAFCSHALMQGIDPCTVQKWMGHKDLNTTLRYAHVSPDHEKAGFSSYVTIMVTIWTPRLKMKINKGFRSTSYNRSKPFIINMVPREGLEPSHPRGYWILNPARLPIPPPRPTIRVVKLSPTPINVNPTARRRARPWACPGSPYRQPRRAPAGHRAASDRA